MQAEWFTHVVIASVVGKVIGVVVGMYLERYFAHKRKESTDK